MDIQKAMDRLKENNYKITKQRQDILNFFHDEDRYHTAKDLHDYMEKYFEGISIDTVYRNLHLYHDLGILESTELNSEKHFRLNCASHHHHHFICNDCGSTKKINFCPMDYLKSLLKNCEVLGHNFEIYGLCSACQT